MKIRKLSGLATISVLMLGLAACGSAAGSGSDGTKEIVIGAVQPITGTQSVFGQGVANALENEVKKANAAGGVEFAGEKVKLKLEVFDDKGTAEGGQAAVREATSEDIEYFVGPFGTASAQGAYSLMAQAKALWVLNTVSTPGMAQAPNTFSTSMTIPSYDASIVQFIKDHPDIKTVSMTTSQAHAGIVKETPNLVKQIEALGVKVAVQATHQHGDTDFRAQITKMIAADTDLYVHRGFPAEMVQVFKQVRELAGPDVYITGNAGHSNAETRKAVGDTSILKNVALVGPVGGGLDVFIAQGNKDAIELNKELQPTPGGFAAYTHDAFLILSQAMAKAKAQTPEALAESLNKLNAADVDAGTLNKFLPRDGGLLFKDREVQLNPAYTVWDQKNDGWVLPKK